MHKRLVVALLLLLAADIGAQDTRAARDAETLDDYQRARSALDLGSFARAIPILEGLLERDPENGDLYYGLGTAYARFGRRQLAVELLMTAFEKGSPGNTYNTAYQIAGLHARLGAAGGPKDRRHCVMWEMT